MLVRVMKLNNRAHIPRSHYQLRKYERGWTLVAATSDRMARVGDRIIAKEMLATTVSGPHTLEQQRLTLRTQPYILLKPIKTVYTCL
jgi:hypothetical protein